MANTMTKIASYTVSSGGATSISFSSIPSTYTDLVVKMSVRNNINGGSPWNDINGTFNSIGTGYSQVFAYGPGGGGVAGATDSYLDIRISGSLSTSNIFSNIEMYIPNYSGSNYKSYFIDQIDENTTSTFLGLMTSGLWSNTSSISSIQFSSTTFLQYSEITLYGI